MGSGAQKDAGVTWCGWCGVRMTGGDDAPKHGTGCPLQGATFIEAASKGASVRRMLGL